ncbi:hypothetical protein NM688_g6737 [Phlebia brevispora]|uniref:Uncharacterized protein n=1 Tax=Phlebia brevispora TaxID=194682 RepID=A0ACC1SD32_9APHY|nr:hypothetical protein NM688_g6737 [Phlebia brevispora]
MLIYRRYRQTYVCGRAEYSVLDLSSLDIDIVQYILNLLKKQREQDIEDNVQGTGASPDGQSAPEKGLYVSPTQENLLSPPSSRFGWASPMSPNSPLIEALSVRFRWKKYHPVRRIRGGQAVAQFSVVKSISIDLPGLTLIHRLPPSPGCHPETFKLTLEKIGLGVALSHPDRVPLHRQWLGRTSAPGDALTADVYAFKFSVNQAALDRVGLGAVIDQLRVVSLGHVRITVLVSQWPSPWLTGPSFLSGDPNSQFVNAHISLGKIEITEHLDVIQKHLSRPRPAKPAKSADGSSILPPVLSPVPRIAFGFHVQEISLRLISASISEEESTPFALEAHTDGFAISANTNFQMLPDHRFAKLPTDPDRPRLEMQMELQATLQRIFVNINRGMGESTTEDLQGALGLAMYPPEPVLSVESIQLLGEGHAFGEIADEVGGSVTIDTPSIFLDTRCSTDAISLELWQPDAMAALRTILSTLSTTSARPAQRDDILPRYLLDSLPSGLSFSVAVARFMVFVTGPDLAPGEDLNISRGVASHMGISFSYCSLHDRHLDGFQNLLSRRQKRLQLSLETELLATAAGGTTVSALTQTQQALMQVSIWDIALRDALSTRFVADDPYGVGDLSEDYRSQEYLRVEKVVATAVVSGRRPGGRPPLGSKDSCAIDVGITRVRGYLDLTHAYNLLLAAQSFKALLPPSKPKSTPVRESTLSIGLQCSMDKVQFLWEFPLRMKLYSRITSFFVQRPASGRLTVKWANILLAVPVDIERDGGTQAEWHELLRFPNWSIDIQPDVHPVAIAAEGDSARLRIPFSYVLADLILDMNVTFKSLKHLVRMVPSGLFSNPPIPEAEEAKSMPNLHLRVGCLSAEAADEEFETRLGLIWRAGFEAARTRLERDDAFEVKVATIRAANNEDLSTPSRELQSEFQFTSEHSVSINEARARLYQVHAGAWKSQFRQAHIQQVRREDEQTRGSARTASMPISLDGDLIAMKPTSSVPPLIRLTFNELSLHLTRPSFASNHLADFLYREGGGMPRETEYSLLIPMHLNFAVSSFRVACREYPLPMLNVPSHSKKDVPGLEFDSDLVIAEEMGTIHTVEWIDCAIVKPHTGVHGASPLYITIPKTINPVKTYADPTIRVKTDDITDFAWGVSYGPVTQDIMRVVDTLSHAPRDNSPPIGFWDKDPVVIGTNNFDIDTGSHDPHGLRGTGAGFALCWQGNPQLLINQENEQNELLQVVSDSVLLIAPNIEESYGETSLNTSNGSRSPTSPTSSKSSKANRSRRVCAKFGSGSRFGVGVVLERTCGPDCQHCSGDAFHRQCRFFNFRPHYDVTLELKDNKPAEKSAEDSYNGFRSDFIHLSISLTSSLTANENEYSSIHFSPEVFAHFWAWWHLFDGTSLPIRQGNLYKHKRPLAPKFGKHLATIKYRIEVPRLFLSHVYTDESRDAWADGVTPFVGVKVMARHFQVDMHQRATETIHISPDGTRKSFVHKPFDAIEVVMKEVDLRALLAVFDTPLKAAVQLDPSYTESSYRKRADMPVVEADSPWFDLDDFRDMECWPPKEMPRLHLLPAGSCPRFTYFKRVSGTATENCIENSKFGSENSHVCLLGREASVPQVQMDIALDRIAELRKMSSDGIDPCVPDSSLRQGSTDTNYMISLLEDYVAHLRQVDAQSRTLPSNGSQYYMPVDSVSPDEWDDFANVYQVHCPRIYLDNSIRDIMMQYYYCSRARRGIEYHMATRAVKFIRDQALAAAEKLQHEPVEHKERRGTAASATVAAAHAVRKMLADGLGSTSVESSPEPLFHTLDNKDPLKGWSKGVSLRKGHFCLLLKPQVVLRCEKTMESVCVLAAVQGKLQTFNIVDDANADDPVSGKVMSRNFASLSGLQAFSPSALNTSGLGVVPLEVLLDLRCGSNYFDRLVPQTDATFHYDKFNRLRLRNEATSALTSKNDVDDQLHNHLHSQNDLVRIHVPHFTVSANDRHFQAISNIVTNLLLFSNVAHKTRAERLEKMLFSYDFTNLGSAADVVAKFQSRLRMAVETKKEAEHKLQSLGSDGQIEKYKIKAHILLLSEELDYVFEAIKLAQDKAAGQAAQKSALLLHASSTEISWRMIDRQDQLLAKLAVRDIDFRWLNRQDSSTVNHLAFGDLQAFDGAADAEWTEILSKYDEPSNHPLVKVCRSMPLHV